MSGVWVKHTDGRRFAFCTHLHIQKVIKHPDREPKFKVGTTQEGEFITLGEYSTEAKALYVIGLCWQQISSSKLQYEMPSEKELEADDDDPD